MIFSSEGKTFFLLNLFKIRFTSYSGTKDAAENLAWLPTSIMGFDANDKPLFAQWNYRIMCHALKNDLPTRYLKPILDPHSQKMYSWDNERYETTRAIRYDLEGMASIYLPILFTNIVAKMSFHKIALF